MIRVRRKSRSPTLPRNALSRSKVSGRCRLGSVAWRSRSTTISGARRVSSTNRSYGRAILIAEARSNTAAQEDSVGRGSHTSVSSARGSFEAIPDGRCERPIEPPAGPPAAGPPTYLPLRLDELVDRELLDV